MHKMRRSDRQTSNEDAIDILIKGEYGIISMVSDGGGYGVPISYAYKNEKIYLHCAKEWEKLKALKANDKVSFTVVGKTEILPEEFSTKFESVIAHGTARFTEGDEKSAGLFALVEKYSPDFLEAGRLYIEKSGIVTEVIAIDVIELTGKARR